MKPILLISVRHCATTFTSKVLHKVFDTPMEPLNYYLHSNEAMPAWLQEHVPFELPIVQDYNTSNHKIIFCLRDPLLCLLSHCTNDDSNFNGNDPYNSIIEGFEHIADELTKNSPNHFFFTPDLCKTVDKKIKHLNNLFAFVGKTADAKSILENWKDTRIDKYKEEFYKGNKEIVRPLAPETFDIIESSSKIQFLVKELGYEKVQVVLRNQASINS